MSGKLTDHLLKQFAEPWKRATQHPFLKQAGERTLKKEVLAEWLVQDAIYAGQGYAKAISSICSHTKPCPVNIFGDEEAAWTRKFELQLDVVKLVGEALIAINAEIKLFRDTAKKHHFDLGPIQHPSYEGVQGNNARTIRAVTRDYVNFMAIISGASLEEGLLLLWAMEEAYLQAWQYAKQQKAATSNVNADVKGVLDAFIDNWTSSEFEAFVQKLRDTVNRLDVKLDPKDRLYQKLEVIFAHTVYLEERFWPEV